jgi:hypothetical protein
MERKDIGEDEGGAAAAAAPGDAAPALDEMAKEVIAVQHIIAALHDHEDGDGAGAAPALDGEPGDLTKSERELVVQVCSATGADAELAELWVRRSKGDVNLAIAEVHAHM